MRSIQLVEVLVDDLDAALSGHQAADLPLFSISISTDACRRDHAQLVDQGVEFDSEPDVQPWGTGVMLRDLVGNRIYLNQEP